VGLRVVAGSARGRRLTTPAGHEVRPTSDRVREAVFNALGSLDAVVGARVVDLFAGSGALGIEALSRGADHAVFVDTSPRALEVVRENVAACGMEDRAQVVRADAVGHLRSTVEPVDLVLADPPYAFDGWPELLAQAAAVAPRGLVVVESDCPVAAVAPASVLRERRYGGTVVTIISHAGSHPPDSPDREEPT
jgi:16S rRNA (guanine966-N2)-methyltransferase